MTFLYKRYLNSPLLLNFYQQYKNKFLLISLFFLVSLLSKKFSLFIPELSINISFDSIPIILVGSYFGAWIGFIFGIATDILGYFLWNPSYFYFWMYTFQAGIIGFLSGFLFKKFKKYEISKNINLFSYKFFITFLLITFSSLIFMKFFLDINNLLISFLFLYSLIFLLIFGYLFKKNRNFLWINYSMIIWIIIAFFASFFWGTYSSLEYFKEVLGIEYTYNNFLIFLSSRIIKEIIKAPILIFMISTVFYFLPPFKLYKNRV